LEKWWRDRAEGDLIALRDLTAERLAAVRPTAQRAPLPTLLFVAFIRERR
jgi:hypothetical protein